jgi:hypothetical protein
MFPSSQDAPSAIGSLMHPNVLSHVSEVHAFWSTQLAGMYSRQWMSHVGQPDGSHCSGNSIVPLPHCGQG